MQRNRSIEERNDEMDDDTEEELKPKAPIDLASVGLDVADEKQLWDLR